MFFLSEKMSNFVPRTIEICYGQKHQLHTTELRIMDIQKIHQYKLTFDSIAKEIKDDEGNAIEVWYARELQQVLGYARWENFVVAVGRAVEACKTMGINVDDHFREVTKMVKLGSGSERGFGRIRSKGDQALFGGLTTEQMKLRFDYRRARSEQP